VQLRVGLACGPATAWVGSRDSRGSSGILAVAARSCASARFRFAVGGVLTQQPGGFGCFAGVQQVQRLPVTHIGRRAGGQGLDGGGQAEGRAGRGLRLAPRQQLLRQSARIGQLLPRLRRRPVGPVPVPGRLPGAQRWHHESDRHRLAQPRLLPPFPIRTAEDLIRRYPSRRATTVTKARAMSAWA
jgi:hypothetical protein